MSIPKEPRQKMINIMYLVLTALLALNVSAEIINAFKTIDNSLGESNKILSSSSENIDRSFKAALNDPGTRERAQNWNDEFDKTRQLTAAVNALIDKYKEELKREAGFDPAKNGDSTFSEENIDAATRLFDTKGEGKKLYAALDQYKKDILGLNDTLSRDLASKLPLNLTVPKSASGNNPTGDVVADWVYGNFHMTPTVAALTMLSKYQNDVKNTENMVLNYCLNKVGATVLPPNKFVAFVNASSSYLMPGEEMEVIAGLGAFNDQVRPEISINGSLQQVGDDGTAKQKFIATGSGIKNIVVNVNFKDPNTGNPVTIPKTITYTVGTPAGVAVMADKMNVLYTDVDNPLTITAGKSASLVKAEFSGGGSFTQLGGNKYTVRPTTLGEGIITVSTKENATAPFKRVGSVSFRVKPLPKPVAFVGELKAGSTVSAARFKAQSGVFAELENSDFNVNFIVESYTIGATGAGMEYIPIPVNGNEWTGAAAGVVRNLKAGSVVIIDNIVARLPSGKRENLKSISYRLN